MKNCIFLQVKAVDMYGRAQKVEVAFSKQYQ